MAEVTLRITTQQVMTSHLPSAGFLSGESRLINIEALLSHSLIIPQFQRPYDWESAQIDDLIKDLQEAQRKKTPLFLGLVVAHIDAAGYAVIDGQQRLTTLMLAIAAKGGSASVLRSYGGPAQLWVKPRNADVSFTKALVRENLEPPFTLSQWLLTSAIRQLKESKDFTLETLLKCEVIVYIAPTLAGATRLFERINLRGKKVSQFDLVKNKLIEWAATISDTGARTELEQFITSRYDDLYKLLDPKASEKPYPSDKLLRVQWILFHDAQFKSSDHVLDRLGTWLEDSLAQGLHLAEVIEKYLDSLNRVAAMWVFVERPYVCDRPELGPKVRQALLDFAKLGREGELQPLLIAALLKFGKDADSVIRFCEINSFRSALAKKNSNHGRSGKWRMARQLYNDTLQDNKGEAIHAPKDLIHQMFWLNTPWWNQEEAALLDFELTAEDAKSEVLAEDAFDNSQFLTQYRHIVHYLFWRYGQFLLSDKEWKRLVQVDINPFQESVWFASEENSFTTWDIEHIYPQTPDDLDSKPGRQYRAAMEHWLNHLGNLTVLPIRDNRGMKNSAFESKLLWMLAQKKVPFNELLSERSYTGNLMHRPHWGSNNCRKRVQWIREFAKTAWGLDAIQALGVGPYDARVRGAEEAELDDDQDPTETP